MCHKRLQGDYLGKKLENLNTSTHINYLYYSHISLVFSSFMQNAGYLWHSRPLIIIQIKSEITSVKPLTPHTKSLKETLLNNKDQFILFTCPQTDLHTFLFILWLRMCMWARSTQAHCIMWWQLWAAATPRKNSSFVWCSCLTIVRKWKEYNRMWTTGSLFPPSSSLLRYANSFIFSGQPCWWHWKKKLSTIL